MIAMTVNRATRVSIERDQELVDRIRELERRTRHRDHGTADRLPRSRRLHRHPRSRHGGESDLRLVAAAQACYR